jgi:CubicO group peptidase (beta-lactamase class C family)
MRRRNRRWIVGSPASVCSTMQMTLSLARGLLIGSLVLGGPVTPAAAQLDSAYARAAQLPRLRSLVVQVDGKIIGERYFRGATRTRRANIKSASKSIIAILVGVAIHEKRLPGLDQRIDRYFPDYFAKVDDPRKRDITVRDLVSMRSGLESTSFNNYGRWVTSGNWVRFALARPMIDQPGGSMIYSTGSSHLLSAILTKATGMSTLRYANAKLGKPLGITIPPWQRDPQGIYFGGNDMYLTPREMLRIGQLYLDRGRYNGKQVVPAEWVDSSLVARVYSPFNGNGYGYGWWTRTTNGQPYHFAWGYGGQFIFVVPWLRAVVVTTSVSDLEREGGHLGAIYDLLERSVIPALEAAAPAAR